MSTILCGTPMGPTCSSTRAVAGEIAAARVTSVTKVGSRLPRICAAGSSTKGNPVLSYSKIRDRFDAKHRRPRSLSRIGEYWYLQYEGGSHSEIIGHNCSSIDSVGLARSKEIEGPWESHPLQLSIPQQPGPSMSSVWTGWPRCTSRGPEEAADGVRPREAPKETTGGGNH